jgi:hypothetical protein
MLPYKCGNCILPLRTGAPISPFRREKAADTVISILAQKTALLQKNIACLKKAAFSMFMDCPKPLFA